MPIKDDYKPPKVTHRKMGNEKKKLQSVIEAFSKVMNAKALRQLERGWTGWDDPQNLLQLRKDLVQHIKEGMYERKDQEEDIALLACFIWFLRLSDEKRQDIIDTWG